MNLCSVELIRKYLEKMIVFFGQDAATFLIYIFLKTYLPKSDVPQPGGLGFLRATFLKEKHRKCPNKKYKFKIQGGSRFLSTRWEQILVMEICRSVLYVAV